MLRSGRLHERKLPNCGQPDFDWHNGAFAHKNEGRNQQENDAMPATTAPLGSDGVALRGMTTADLPAAHALTDALHWPHRQADWEQAFRHAEGLVAERDG